MSPCEEGMSPYLIKFEKIPPLITGFKKVVLETTVITIAALQNDPGPINFFDIVRYTDTFPIKKYKNPLLCLHAGVL